jgi:hypothetical protein
MHWGIFKGIFTAKVAEKNRAEFGFICFFSVKESRPGHGFTLIKAMIKAD